MEIKNFEKIRAGGEFPATIDLSPIGGHSSYGVCAEAWIKRADCGFEKDHHRVEVRRKDNLVALLVYKFDDMILPPFWVGSELLWESCPRAESPK